MNWTGTARLPRRYDSKLAAFTYDSSEMDLLAACVNLCVREFHLYVQTVPVCLFERSRKSNHTS